MKKTIFSRATALLLSVFILLSVTTAATAVAAEGESDPVIVLAGSDFQGKIWDATKNDGVGAYVFSHEESSTNVKAIISAAKADGINSVDGFLFAGDYNYTNFGNNSTGVSALKSTVQEEYTTLKEENMVFVQGNHDDTSTVGLSTSGANDTADYGVFVINEDDYMWKIGEAAEDTEEEIEAKEAIVQKTAASLGNYLEEKSNANYSKPVFVVSHLPLNYNRRVISEGGGVFAKYIFDELNKYGESLNIIFMFGHNHSGTVDNYLGGDAVYLTVGDTIYIAQSGEQNALPGAYKLNFTYLNAGYVGESRSLNNVLTMTAFVIKDDIVEIRRYSKNGRYALKTKGAWASTDTEKIGAEDNYLLTEYTGPDFIGNSASDEDVTVVSSKITGLTVNEPQTESDPDIYTAYTNYEITPQGYSDGTFAYVKIALDQSFDLDAPVFARDTKTNKVTLCTVQNGKATFTTNSLSSYELYQTEPAIGDINSDYIADIRDLVRLKKIVAGLENPDLEKWDGEAASSFAGGSGTEEAPYLIENGGQLYKMVSEFSNVEVTKTDAEHKYFEITKDIDLNNKQWYMLTTALYKDSINVGFNGIVEGNGHTIYNFYSGDTSACVAGLIPVATQGAEIHNLNLVNGSITTADGADASGALIGGAKGTDNSIPIVIDRCSVTGFSVTGASSPAGLVGRIRYQSLKITNCYVNNTTITNTSDANNVGQFWGYADKGTGNVYEITNSYCVGRPARTASIATVTNVYTNTLGELSKPYGFTVLADDQMKGEAAKTNMEGFDFDNVWQINANSYPTLMKPQLEKWDGEVASSFAGGKGTKDAPYLIKNGGQLYRMVSEFSNVDVTKTDADHTYFEIIKDIDLNNKQWYIIKTTLTSTNTTVGFNGIVEGNGHTIYNLYSGDTSACAAGLIPVATQGAEIHNLNLANGSITTTTKSGDASGALIGGAKGTNNSIPIVIDKCSVTGFEITGTDSPAGLVGRIRYQSLKITNCYVNNTTVTNTTKDKEANVGQFWGYADKGTGNVYEITNSYCVGRPARTASAATASHVYTNTLGGLSDPYDFTVLADDQMKGEAAKTNMEGFDFDNVWQINEDGYPTFKNTSNADLNSDGKVDSLDLALMREYLLQMR